MSEIDSVKGLTELPTALRAKIKRLPELAVETDAKRRNVPFARLCRRRSCALVNCRHQKRIVESFRRQQ